MGDTVAQALIEFAGDERNNAIIEELLAELIILEYTKPTDPRVKESLDNALAKLPLEGKRVVFTGRLVTMPRSKAEEYCQLLGMML
jgi:NAD-dependent DNA ligase